MARHGRSAELSSPMIPSLPMRHVRGSWPEPDRVPHIREASKFLGNCCVEVIDQAGETVQSQVVPFEVVPEFEFLRQLHSSP